MKKFVIKLIRNIMYFSLKHFKYTGKTCTTKELDKIKSNYDSKKLQIVNNEIKVDSNVDLTIVVPVYNARKHINKCIDSIVNQETEYTYNVILINDGSDDGTIDILKSYEKKYDIIKVFSQENTGIAETRNKGIKNITGKYVAFIDSDDYIENSYVERLLDCAYKNNADVVRCNYYEYDVDKNFVIKTGKSKANKTYINGLGKDIIEYKGYPWGGVFRSSLWNQIEFPNGYWYEDMIIRMICFREAKIFSYINEKLYYYCIHDNNISKSIEKTENIKSLDQLFLIIELYKLSKELGIEDDEALYYCLMYEFSVVLWLRTRKIDKKLRREVFQYVCDFVDKIDYNEKLINDVDIICKIFKRKDYINWKLYAIYKMLGVKYGVE